MRNLLSANLMRLRHSRVLWLCMAYMLYEALTLFYRAAQMDGTSRWAPSFQFFWLGGVVFAVYCSFFIAGEYAEGGVRRKVAVGSPRPAVYLASLVSCAMAGLLMCAVYILSNWPLEYFLVGTAGGLEYPCTTGQTALLLVECAAVILSYSAIFTMVGMNVQHKTGGPVAVLLTAAALTYFGQNSRTMLLLYDSSPENYRFSPLTLFRHRLFSDWLPGGQAVHCIDLGSFQAPETMILHALVVIVISTAAGLALFQRKDLK